MIKIYLQMAYITSTRQSVHTGVWKITEEFGMSRPHPPASICRIPGGHSYSWICLFRSFCWCGIKCWPSCGRGRFPTCIQAGPRASDEVVVLPSCWQKGKSHSYHVTKVIRLLFEQYASIIHGWHWLIIIKNNRLKWRVTFSCTKPPRRPSTEWKKMQPLLLLTPETWQWRWSNSDRDTKLLCSPGQGLSDFLHQLKKNAWVSHHKIQQRSRR